MKIVRRSAFEAKWAVSTRIRARLSQVAVTGGGFFDVSVLDVIAHAMGVPFPIAPYAAYLKGMALDAVAFASVPRQSRRPTLGPMTVQRCGGCWA
jgi:VIT1/CCC1 family predicted Fe2+/Mn2+ transporter